MDEQGSEDTGQVEELDERGATSEVLLGLIAEWFDGPAADWTNTTALDFLQSMYAGLMTFEPGWRGHGRDPDDGWSEFRHALLAGPGRRTAPSTDPAPARPRDRTSTSTPAPAPAGAGGGSVREPEEARGALGRLLTKEDRVSDLVALLAGLDHAPLLSVLGLRADDLRVTREEQVRGVLDGRGRPGRADLVLRDGDRLLAVLEVKAAAGPHGDQLAAYQAWRDAQDPPAGCFLVALAGDTPGVPAGWRTDITLPVLLGAWTGSAHPHASWLGGLAAGILEDWAGQFEREVGLATHPVVADLVAKQIAVDLCADSRLRAAGLWVAGGTRTSGGTASVVARLPYQGPGATGADWLCVDLRSPKRARPDLPWLLRLGVEVSDANMDTGAARARAHDLAVLVRPHLTRSAFTHALRRADRQDLAEAVVPPVRRPGLDGLRGDADDRLDSWRARALAGEAPGRHPVMYDDWGRRLASQLLVDVTRLDRHDLLTVLVHALDHLAAAEPAAHSGRATHSK